jgi:hypothetical protein
MTGQFIVQKDTVEKYTKKGETVEKQNRVLSLVEMGEHALGVILRYVCRRDDKLPESNTAGKVVTIAVTGFRESWKGVEATGSFLGLVKAA